MGFHAKLIALMVVQALSLWHPTWKLGPSKSRIQNDEKLYSKIWYTGYLCRQGLSYFDLWLFKLRVKENEKSMVLQDRKPPSRLEFHLKPDWCLIVLWRNTGAILITVYWGCFTWFWCCQPVIDACSITESRDNLCYLILVCKLELSFHTLLTPIYYNEVVWGYE